MAHQMAHRTVQRLQAPSPAALVTLQSAIASLSISSSQTSPSHLQIQRRNASHAAQGRANGAKQGPGKRLGSKKTAGQYVVPGNILYRQRGTLWFPGDGCFMGRDHTIHAKVPGYVKFYRDPARPQRKYIGVVFERNNVLPQPFNAVRKRLLGMLAYQMPETKTEMLADDLTNLAAVAAENVTDQDAGNLSTVTREAPKEYRRTAIVRSTREDGEVIETKLSMHKGYQWRQSHYELGKAALRSDRAMKVQPYDPKDRFLAWRKRNARKARSAERRAMGRGGKAKAKKK